MKDKLIQLVVLIPLVILALVPPVNWSVPIIANSTLWLWLVLLSGFMGFLFLYTNTNIILKIFVIYIFFNAVASKAPYLSLTSYIILIPTIYYYYIATKISNWDNILKVIQAIFWMITMMIFLQLIGLDRLCNFGQENINCWGFTGNSMWLACLVSCMAPFLIIRNKLNIIPIALIFIVTKSSGGLVCLLAGIIFYILMSKRKKIFIILLLSIPILLFAWNDSAKIQLKSGRWPVWKRTLEMVSDRPMLGWGIGTYKVIIPSVTKDVAGGTCDKWEYEGTKGNWIRWMQAHNCFLQILFETGFIGFALFLLILGFTFAGVLINKDAILAASGAVMIFVNMMVHYPTRMNQTVLILICFFAYLGQLRRSYGKS